MPEPLAPVTRPAADGPVPEAPAAAAPGGPPASRLRPRRRSRAAAARAAWRLGAATGQVDVSVCIANWNCRDLLRACLESLHDQPQGVSLETIVVDNGSADGAAAMVEREFPEVILQRNPTNLGFARANNQAAGKARGRYLLFLNNDTVVPAGTRRRLVESAAAHPQVGMIGPRLRDGRGHTQVSYRQRPTLATLLHRTSLLRWTGLLRDAYRRYRRQEFDPESTREVEVLMGAAMFLPRDVFFACGGWDEEFTFGGEDLDLSLRVGRSRPVVYHPSVEITHYGRVSTRQHIGYASSHMAVGFVRYLRKSGCSGPGLLAYKALVSLDAPLQLVLKGAQYALRRALGERAKAAKSLLALRGVAHFLRRGLVTFWRA
jgi:N-acetylglucosaminyl-diphospho-decaprenol L-rhamnosyltransferase